jgi:hypothetical protein
MRYENLAEGSPKSSVGLGRREDAIAPKGPMGKTAAQDKGDQAIQPGPASFSLALVEYSSVVGSASVCGPALLEDGLDLTPIGVIHR